MAAATFHVRVGNLVSRCLFHNPFLHILNNKSVVKKELLSTEMLKGFSGDLKSEMILLCVWCSGFGPSHQPSGVQCQEQVLSDGDGDGGRSGSLQLHRPAEPSAPRLQQHRPTERHRCPCTGMCQLDVVCNMFSD